MSYVFGMAVIAAVAISSDARFSPSAAAADPNAAPNPYRVDEGWAKPVMGRNFGSTISINVDVDGESMWVFDRCGGFSCTDSNIAPIQKFDSSGRLVAAFGVGLFNFPHGMDIDREGNVWVTDATGGDGKGHVVVKLSPAGEVLMTLGRPGVAGNGPDTFNRPSDVAIAPNGDIFVGDGHGGDSNARVVRFSADGTFIAAWDRRGTARGEFGEPHALAIDSAGRIFVGDRANSRIQIFDADGNVIDEWRQFGRPSGLFIDKDDILYVADSQSDDMINPGYKMGVRIGSVRDGRVTAFIGEDEVLGAPEGIAADHAGNVYTGYTGNTNFRRYVRR